MTDEEIISLYFDRSEEAIAATQRKYDGYCRSLIGRILGSPRDTEEIVSDLWLKAWLSIPPNRPSDLKLYLAKIGRNLALNRLREGRAAKRGEGADAVLEELSEVLGGSTTRSWWTQRSCRGPSTPSWAVSPGATATFSCVGASTWKRPTRSLAAMACARTPSTYPCTAPGKSSGNT